MAEDTPPTTPNTSTDYIVSQTAYTYDSTGPVVSTTDNAGIVTQTQLDLAGRTVRTIQDYVNGKFNLSHSDRDVITDYAYDAGGRLAATTTYDVAGDGSTLPAAQTTLDFYGSAAVAGGACPVDASLTTNVVDPDSADLAMFSAGTFSLSQSGGTATATVNNSFEVGDWVSISGASQAGYNGTFQVTYATASYFTYTVPVSTPSPATGASVALLSQEVTLGQTGGTATATLAAGNNYGYAVGDWVLITGANEAAYDGLVQITAAPSGGFKYSVLPGAPTMATGGDIQAWIVSRHATSLTRSGTVATATIANTYQAGEVVSISGANNPGFDGVFVVQSATSTSFTFTVSSSLPSSDSSTNIQVRLVGGDEVTTAYDWQGENRHLDRPARRRAYLSL